MTHLPLQLRVAGRRCTVVGAGRVATRRVLRLLAHGAQVVVVAPEVSPAIEELADRGSVELRRRAATETDLDGAVLAVLCTDDPALHDRLERAPGPAFVTRADDAAGDLLWMAERDLGSLCLAVGTDGRAPAVGAWAADVLAQAAPEVLGADADTIRALVELMEEVRRDGSTDEGTPSGAEVDESGPPRLNWRSVLDRSMLELIRSGRTAEAKERLKACRSSS
jgi:siroheme synthase-like protein